MNASRFAFTHQPFPAVPRIEQYVDVGNSDSIRRYSIDAIKRSAGPTVILGGAGLGKTITCMRIIQSCSNMAETIFLSSSQIASRADLLKSLLYELHMPYRGLFDGELRLSLIERLQHQKSSKSERVVLVVDEAQALSPRLLEELRLLTNLTSNGLPCLSLILCGSLKLEEMLNNPQLESLQQRVTARHFLRPLNHPECHEYLRHRIELAGVVADQVFDESAIDAIYLVSNGIPRLIDQIADRAISMDDGKGMKALSAQDIERAWQASQQATPPWTDMEAIPLYPSTSTNVNTATPALPKVVPNTAAMAATQMQQPTESPSSIMERHSTKDTSENRAKPSKVVTFADSDLSGWVPEHSQVVNDETSQSQESSFAAQLRGTPPSAGMGLSHVFAREHDAEVNDNVKAIEDSLNQFDSQAVTHALQQSFENGELPSAHYEPMHRKADESVGQPELEIQDLDSVTAGYGQHTQDRRPFDLQPVEASHGNDIEDDLFEMISNINLESISIDPFFDVSTAGAMDSLELVKNIERSSTEEEESLANVSGMSSSPLSFFCDLDQGAEDFIEVQDVAPNYFQFQSMDDAVEAKLDERLRDLDDIANITRHDAHSLSMSGFDDQDSQLVPTDDRDIIIVEEDIEATDEFSSKADSMPVANALMQSYSKLFSGLRG